MTLNIILQRIYEIVVTITMLYSIFLWLKKKYTYKQKYFYIYIFLVFFVDVLMPFFYNDLHLNLNYFILSYIFLSIIYFFYFYIVDYDDSSNRIFLIISTIIAFFACVYFQLKQTELMISNNLLLVYISYILIIVLQWFWYIINNIDSQNILHKQSFWASSALLIWSVFAFFRMYPMYYLNTKDVDFLNLIVNSFQIVNIITYLLFLKGLKSVNYNILRTFNFFNNK